MDLSRRLFLSTPGLLICSRAFAQIDPEAIAQQHDSLLHVGLESLKLGKTQVAVGEQVPFSVTLDLTDSIADTETIKGTILCFIEGEGRIESQRSIGPLTFTPLTIQSAPLRTSGPKVVRVGRKRFYVLSADTYIVATFTAV
ncbi:hypothetical protein [Microvirga subterranea]|uniref:hypothetical protein n=1 Tax=Microvirga subterranea TaxID=186651 RepID=UPI0011C0304D|nr:hypothetical protein [Microvirga subterranea]